MVVLDTVRSEIISDTEVEGPTDLVSIKDQIVEDKTKQTVVVTASKVVKPLSRKNETNEMHYASRNEDNLTGKVFHPPSNFNTYISSMKDLCITLFFNDACSDLVSRDG